MAQRPVTLADIVRGHLSLEIEGFDRLYFNGWVPALQTSGQIAGWLHWRGFPIASPAAPTVEAGREVRPATPPAPAPGASDVDRGDKPGLALHTFAMVPATGPEVTASEAVTATLSFGTAALDLPADRAAQVKADVYALGRPPAKSILAGRIQVDISPGEQVRLQIPCQLPAIGYPVGLFAIVRLFTAGKAGRIPSSGLPNAEVTLLSATAADNRRSTEGGPSTAGGPREVISGR